MSRVQQFFVCLVFVVAMSTSWFVAAFSPMSSRSQTRYITAARTTPPRTTTTTVAASSTTAGGDDGDSELVAKRIIVTGDVMGGYYRACVKNEASRFRRLVGTMSPPDDTKEAEIYVEGKRKMVDGFVRWVQRGNVGLSQMTSVKDVIEEEPTGLYDAFYIKMREPETASDGPN